MPVPEPGALCVSVHDVAPVTWPDCLLLWQAVRAVADIPLTWLVVPHYHPHEKTPCGVQDQAPSRSILSYEAALEGLLARGHELVLHGYTHSDDGPPPRGLRQTCLRQVYTQGEGEFAALDEAEARWRLALGQAWFARRGWPLHGFVAPAWLLSEGAWAALHDSPLRYTTTLRHFHWLGSPGHALRAPSLVYAARNAPGRMLSPLLVSAQRVAQSRAPLIRLSLHPRDARYPALLRHLQGTIARLMAGRQPMTKAAFAALHARRG